MKKNTLTALLVLASFVFICAGAWRLSPTLGLVAIGVFCFLAAIASNSAEPKKKPE